MAAMSVIATMPVYTGGCPDNNWVANPNGLVLGPDGISLGTCGSGGIGPVNPLFTKLLSVPWYVYVIGIGLIFIANSDR